MTPTIRRAAMVATIALSAATSAWLWPDPSAPNLTYRPDMADSPALRTHEPFANSLAGTVDRTRPPGVVPRDGPAPIRYAATEADAIRAGREMAMPAALAAGGTPARAATLFEDFCQPCHGREGHGDGLTIKRGFQPPPSLLTQRARDLEDGRMFHILTFGQKADVAAWSLSGLILLFSGIYYPVDVLPFFLQVLARAIPLTYFLEYYRSIFIPGPHHLAVGLSLAALYLLLGLILFDRAIRRARRTGILLWLSE